MTKTDFLNRLSFSGSNLKFVTAKKAKYGKRTGFATLRKISLAKQYPLTNLIKPLASILIIEKLVYQVIMLRMGTLI